MGIMLQAPHPHLYFRGGRAGIQSSADDVGVVRPQTTESFRRLMDDSGSLGFRGNRGLGLGVGCFLIAGVQSCLLD